jgi:hypothetical protein
MFMRYMGGGIGHHMAATDSTSKEIGIAEDDPDLEMNLEGANEDANPTQGDQVDDLKDPNEGNYEHDNIAHSEVGAQDDELNDYEYIQEAMTEPERDPNNEGELEGIVGFDLGPEDGEDDEYSHSDLEYCHR